MHPLDSSLDASVHNHSRNNPIRKRASLDNGNFATNELMMLLRRYDMDDSTHYGGGAADDDDDDDDFNSNNIMKRNTYLSQRRLSWNKGISKTTTFLAALNGSAFNKGELDLDCHTESRHNTKRFDLAESSFHSRQNRQQRDSNELNTGTDNTRITSVVSDDDDDDDNIDDTSGFGDDDDGDSFCDASCAEPANQEYMMQELGVSCMWDDEAFFEEVEKADVGMSQAELDIETADYCYDNVVIAGASPDTPSARNRTILNQDKIGDIGGIDDHDGYDSSDDCDSFCDANEHDRANKSYLKKDLGASCLWDSNDELMLDSIEDEINNERNNNDDDDDDNNDNNNNNNNNEKGIGPITE